MRPIVSKNIRIRHPQNFEIGQFSIVDDFCYFSTPIKIGLASHISSGCTISGGLDYKFQLGDFSSLSGGVKISCASNNFATDLVMIEPEGFGLINSKSIKGDVTLANYAGVGANSVVMPLNSLPEGPVVGSLIFVPSNFKFESWSVYAGIPVRRIASRNRENVLNQVQQLRAYFDQMAK